MSEQCGSLSPEYSNLGYHARVDADLREDLAKLNAAFQEGQPESNRHRLFRALAKKYHPDSGVLELISGSVDPMAAINVVYASLRAGRTLSIPPVRSEATGNARRDDKDNAAFEMLKEGERLRDIAMSLIEQRYRIEENLAIVAEASGVLYESQCMMRRVLDLYPDSVWAHDAASKMDWCRRINERITRRLMSESDSDALATREEKPTQRRT